jgi:hypothetical protein
VRGSAAFPPAIPPISLHINTTWVRAYSPENPEPTRLWLTDGGAFNNFGTEWHHVRRELYGDRCAFFERLDPEQRKHLGVSPTAGDDGIPTDWQRDRYGQVQLVVDASHPNAASPLTWLRYPITGLLTYTLRIMNVMYGSTLAGRSSESERTASSRMKKYPRKWLAQHDGLDTFEHIFKDHPETFSPEKDDDLLEQGALRLYVPHSRPLNYIRVPWAPHLAFDTQVDAGLAMRWHEGNLAAAREMDSYWPWTGETQLIRPRQEAVPTTFRKLGREDTLKLIVEGYFKTREVLFWSLGYQGPAIPSQEDFTSLIPTDAAS